MSIVEPALVLRGFSWCQFDLFDYFLFVMQFCLGVGYLQGLLTFQPTPLYGFLCDFLVLKAVNGGFLASIVTFLY